MDDNSPPLLEQEEFYPIPKLCTVPPGTDFTLLHLAYQPHHPREYTHRKLGELLRHDNNNATTTTEEEEEEARVRRRRRRHRTPLRHTVIKEQLIDVHEKTYPNLDTRAVDYRVNVIAPAVMPGILMALRTGNRNFHSNMRNADGYFPAYDTATHKNDDDDDDRYRLVYEHSSDLFYVPGVSKSASSVSYELDRPRGNVLRAHVCPHSLPPASSKSARDYLRQCTGLAADGSVVGDDNLLYVTAELRAQAYHGLVGSALVYQRTENMPPSPLPSTKRHVSLLTFNAVYDIQALYHPDIVAKQQRKSKTTAADIVRAVHELAADKNGTQTLLVSKYPVHTALVHAPFSLTQLVYVLMFRHRNNGHELTAAITDIEASSWPSSPEQTSVVAVMREYLQRNQDGGVHAIGMAALGLIAWYELAVMQQKSGGGNNKQQLLTMREHIGRCYLSLVDSDPKQVGLRRSAILKRVVLSRRKRTNPRQAAAGFEITDVNAEGAGRLTNIISHCLADVQLRDCASQLMASVVHLAGAGLCTPALSPARVLVATILKEHRLPPDAIDSVCHLDDLVDLTMIEDTFFGKSTDLETMLNVYRMKKKKNMTTKKKKKNDPHEEEEEEDPYRKPIVRIDGKHLVLLDVLGEPTSHSAIADRSAAFMRDPQTLRRFACGSLAFAFPRHLLNGTSPRTCALGEVQNTWSLGATLFAIGVMASSSSASSPLLDASVLDDDYYGMNTTTTTTTQPAAMPARVYEDYRVLTQLMHAMMMATKDDDGKKSPRERMEYLVGNEVFHGWRRQAAVMLHVALFNRQTTNENERRKPLDEMRYEYLQSLPGHPYQNTRANKNIPLETAFAESDLDAQPLQFLGTSTDGLPYQLTSAYMLEWNSKPPSALATLREREPIVSELVSAFTLMVPAYMMIYRKQKLDPGTPFDYNYPHMAPLYYLIFQKSFFL